MHTILEWGKTLLIAGSLALLIRWSFAEPYKIPSGSMEPTLMGHPGFMRGDRVFVNKWYYGLRYPFMNRRIWRGAEPERWEVVVFKSIEENAQHGTLVKRIVGMPGERVLIRNGRLHVDGEPLELPDHMPDVHYTTAGRFGVIDSDMYSLIPDDHYLLLGDNSAHSRDGRHWGFVPNEHIVGRVFCIWWPPQNWRDFTGFTETWWWRTLLALLSVYIIWRVFFGRSLHIHKPAPDAALTPGDHVYIDRIAYGVPIPFMATRATAGRPAKRGEVVVYEVLPEEGREGGYYLGRIAGLPGEKVLVEDGRIQINGEPVAEGPLADHVFPSTKDTGPYGRSKGKDYSQVPDNAYFMLSDHPSGDCDSRTQGWIHRRQVMGVVTSIWWPWKRRRRLEP